MIIQIRGTNGSGKTWVMKHIMFRLGNSYPQYLPKRKQPLWYRFSNNVAVLGGYESVCGGCDNIGSAAQCYKEIVTLDSMGFLVVCEGLLLSEDVKWSSQLPELRVIYLTTPMPTCVSQTKMRREASGNFNPLNETKINSRADSIERSRIRLLEVGVHCVRCSSSQASSIVINWIRKWLWTKNKAGLASKP